MKLGRSPSLPDARDLRLASYIVSRPTAAPLSRNWTRTPTGAAIKFSAFGNHDYGCCTCTALANIEQAASVWTKRPTTIDQDFVLEGYDAISDWSRTSPRENDNGASCRDALKWFKAKGVIEKYLRVDAVDFRTLQVVNNIGGAIYVGANLPRAAQRQAVWDVPAGGKLDGDFRPRTWGGHAMAMLGADHLGVWFVTWGRPQRATWAWVSAYVDERWLAIADKWTEPGKLTPSGFDMARLDADVARVASSAVWP